MENNEEVSTLVAFSASFVKILSSHRLPPTYVGVPRRRPSSKEVQSAWRSKSDGAPSPRNVSFIVKDDAGHERRMTKQEKKETKRRMLEEKQEEKRKRMGKTNGGGNEGGARKEDEISPYLVEQLLQCNDSSHSSGSGNYHRLPVSSAAIEEELADLRGDRDGVPPVALLPCMALQTFQMGILSPQSAIVKCELDNLLAQAWATSLKEGLREAEDVRSREDLRPMAYQLAPEVWRRLVPDMSKAMDDASIVERYEGIDFSLIPIRSRMDPLDSDKAVVCTLLHTRSNVHISCGSKFGCDFLLYDGPRTERHAFAGLRVIADGETPGAYDLHGYVRCLNTAGKLSLLAKVDRGGDIPRVAFVDLTLEKVLTAPRHAKRATKRARREVGNNLAKKGNPPLSLEQPVIYSS
ncbi:DUF547 containing protein [Fragilaria crotonensis]|nr:DUF547 containing protein [Fragilaria crotonensis]